MAQLTTRQLARKRSLQTKLNQRTSMQPGDMLQDRYQIVGTLGVGGFSSVYQARDMRFPNVTKLCAIKEMVISTNDPHIRDLTIKSFEREASMLAMLDHPAIPDVSDYFTEKDRSYLVLELIRGKDLEDWLQERTDPLDQATALEWMLQLCDALSHLHTQKPQTIVFRDLKPSNIMLDQYNRIRLIDFGIAKIFESDFKGTMIGTEGYSPPEQYRGEATPAGDVYALGATMHHLLTRQDPRLEPPFTFAERPIRSANPAVTPEFEALIMRCLSYDLKARYPDAMALRDALKAFQSGTMPQMGTPTMPMSTAYPQGVYPPQMGSTMNTPTTLPPANLTAVANVAPNQITPLWTFKCEDEIRRRAAVARGMVFVGAYDNNLYAIGTDSGEFIWKYPTSDGVASAPCVHEESVFIGSTDKNMYCLQRRTGRMNWQFQTGGAIYSSPTVKFDHLFFGSDDGFFYALNATRGKQAWRVNSYSPVRSSPFVSEEFVFFGTEGAYIYCLAVSTGKAKWQTQAKRAVTSSPKVMDDVVYVGSMDATVYAVDAGSGWTIWRFRAKRPIISSPTIDKDAVYIGSSDGCLYALDTSSGRQLWAYETKGQVAGSPAVQGDSVYIGATDGNVYCLSTKKGEVRWQFKTGGAVIASPVIADGVLYVGSTDKNLYALPL